MYQSHSPMDRMGLTLQLENLNEEFDETLH